MLDSTEADDDNFFLNNLARPTNEMQSVVDSPPSLGKGSNEDGGLLDGLRASRCGSPLLETTPMPTDDLSICPYCNKNFRKPRVLDCLHSMCEDCVIAQLDGRNDGKRAAQNALEMELEQKSEARPTPPGVIRCPICDQESHVGNDVRFVNFMLLDFIRIRDADKPEKDNGERICRACKGEQPAVATCRHCCSDLCKNCVQAHHDMRMFDGHKVVLFSEIEKETVPNEQPVEVALCVHHQSTYEHMCINCDELLCASCLQEHRNHSITPICDMVFQFYSGKLKDLAGKVEAKSSSASEARSSIPDRLTELSSAYDKCEAKIKESFAAYEEALKEVKKKVLTDLEKKRDEQEEHFNNLYQKIDLEAAKMQDALNFTNRLLEKGTAVELCASRKKVWQQLQMLLRSMPDTNTEIDLDFETFSPAEFQQKLEAIVGSVQCRLSMLPAKDEKVLASVLNSNSETVDRPKFISSTVPWDTDHASVSNPYGVPGEIQGRRNTQGSPGTIGMERRLNRNSMSTNGGSLFGDDQPANSLIPSPPSLNNNDSLGLTRLNLGDPNMYGSGLRGGIGAPTPGGGKDMSLMSQTFGNSAALDPFAQSKIWGAPYNNQPLGYGMDASRMKPGLDPRMLGVGVGDYGGMDQLFQQASRSSQCTTPSFDGNYSLVGGLGNDKPAFPMSLSSSRLNAPGEMTIHSMFGAAGGLDTLNTPQGLTLGIDDEIVVADTNNHRCVVLNTAGKLLRTIGTPGTEDGCLYYPKKVVTLIHGRDCRYIVLDRGTGQMYSRLQLFSMDGEYLGRLMPQCVVDQITVMALNKEAGQLVIIDCKNNIISFDMDVFPQMRPVRAFSCATYLQEASDMAIYKGLYYITDYKTHSVVVCSMDGKFVTKYGNNTLTPYPIGIDISKSGDILVGDSHGNHFHVVAFNCQGKPQQEFKCMTLKVSRCTGLRITTEGLIVTMSRQNNSVIVFNTLYMAAP